MLRGVILGTCNLLSEVLDERFVHPVIHRDTSWDTLGGPDLDFIDLSCVLGPPRELLSGQFGRKIVIVDVNIDVGIRKLLSKKFG